MTITFFCNYLNHHQIGLADALYGINGNDYHFVVTQPTDETLLKGGKDYSHLRNYVISVYDGLSQYEEATKLAVNSDVCVFGGQSMEFAVIRAKTNPNGLSFEQGERWLKRGWLNILSPHLLKWRYQYFHLYKNANFHYLCSSSYGAEDLNKLGTYQNRCYKWGYFTVVGQKNEIEASKQGASISEITPLMWCSRFLRWKHPELPIRMAEILKREGYKFQLDMYGDGEQLIVTKDLVGQLDVGDVVKFYGAMSNDRVLEAMRQHDIFLFTSDKHEGWGAVANESMSCGCALVGSDAIGSVNYLIPDQTYGMVFKSEDVDSLTSCVRWLLDNPAERVKIQRKAKHQIQSVWSPSNAANNFIVLSEDLLNNRKCSIVFGPCSKA